MSSRHSLEEERQAILSRMSASREDYRRALAGEATLHRHDGQLQVEPLHDMTGSYDMASHYVQPHNPALELAETALSWVKQHPFLCAAAVAAIVAIGPGRIGRSTRTVLSGGTALAALTLRNTKNIQTATRLIASVAERIQRSRQRYPP